MTMININFIIGGQMFEYEYGLGLGLY